MYYNKHIPKFVLLTALVLTCMLTACLLLVQVNRPALAGTKCGKGGDTVVTAIDFGCRGDANPNDINPILDMLFAVVRFLTAGVGIVIVASVVVGGLQYTTAQGEPQKQTAARSRVISALGALLLYLFAFALLQWLIPGGVY